MPKKKKSPWGEMPKKVADRMIAEEKASRYKPPKKNKPKKQSAWGSK